MKIKHIVSCILIVLLGLTWLFRYITLNNGLKVNSQYEQTFYEEGEIVAFGNNMSSGIQYYKDYALSVDNCKIYDSDEYISILDKTDKDFQLLIPDKIVELTVTLYNNGDTEDGIYFSSLELVGNDWYEYYNSEFTAYANDIYEDDVYSSYGIIVKPQDSYTIKLIYSLSKRGRTLSEWKRIEEEEMYLEITLKPINQFIKLF
jgi:hypothetical protein